MRDSLAIMRRPGRWLLPLGCLAVLAYFGLNAFVGDRGILSHRRIEAQSAQLRAELDARQAERRRLEAKIALLNSNKIDPDMLDERARSILNFADPDDLVIFRVNK